MNTLSLAAPAKVNLFLEVTGKLPNGYHELATLFAKISLADRISVSAQVADKEKLSLRITGPLANGLEADENNLVFRAVRAFEEEFGLPLKADIVLEKNIPMGAGLGGGSSDAGTTLRALCRIFAKDPMRLLPRAAKLGADVPLFLYPDPFLKGEGIGEKLTPIPVAGSLPWLVLVYPDSHVSTKGVFNRLHLNNPKQILTNISNLDRLLLALASASPLPQWQPLLFNRLEEAVLPYVDAVKKAKEDFLSLGACPLMSGSGSTVFALTPSQEQAQDLAAKMQQENRKVFIAHFGGTNDENN